MLLLKIRTVVLQLGLKWMCESKETNSLKTLCNFYVAVVRRVHKGRYTFWKNRYICSPSQGSRDKMMSICSCSYGLGILAACSWHVIWTDLCFLHGIQKLIYKCYSGRDPWGLSKSTAAKLIGKKCSGQRKCDEGCLLRQCAKDPGKNSRRREHCNKTELNKHSMDDIRINRFYSVKE